MVDVPSYSALPHAIMRDTSLSRDARLLYAILQGRWWQNDECYASHATLAGEMGCTPRYLRVYLDELIAAGLVIERPAGTRRAKVYTPVSIGAELPIDDRFNTSESSDCSPSNTSKTSHCDPSNAKFETVQSEVLDTSNTSKTSDSYKKTPEKKKEKKKDGVADATPAAAAAVVEKRERVLLSDLSEDARTVLDDWRRKLGKRRAPELNPVLAAELEKATADLGTAWLFQANTWAAKCSVRELIKAIRAGYTMREGAEAEGKTQEIGTASHPVPGAPKVKPATDEDRAIWGRAQEALRSAMNAANWNLFIRPLTVAGRGADGGLRLLVPSGMSGDVVKRFHSSIVRELIDAGDQHATQFGFVARRSSP